MGGFKLVRVWVLVHAIQISMYVQKDSTSWHSCWHLTKKCCNEAAKFTPDSTINDSTINEENVWVALVIAHFVLEAD
jgi:hypothetical protein